MVILWGERLTGGPRDAHAARALLNVAGRLGLRGHDGAGLLEVPAAANGRGLREAGVLPNAGPGPPSEPARRRPRRPREIAAGRRPTASWPRSTCCTPTRSRDHADAPLWHRALARASTVVAHASFLTDGLREHATVVFPAESYAEKEGTVTHPDGRLQRLRPAIGRPGDVRAEWQVLAELGRALGARPERAHRRRWPRSSYSTRCPSTPA